MTVVQGITSASLETLVTSPVFDIYFIHQPDTRIGIWAACLLVVYSFGMRRFDQSFGTFIDTVHSQTISGVFIQNIAYAVTFGISAFIFIPILIGVYFFVVETTYNGARTTGKKAAVDKKHVSFLNYDEEREKYRSQLSIFCGRMSQESFRKKA
jgi:hypothetical protein